MKRLLLFFFYFSISAYCFGQKSSVHQKGSKVILLGYGFGNLWKQFLEEGVSFPQFYTVSGQGPVALTLEYGLHNNVSVGIAGGYSKLKGVYAFGGFSLIDELENISLLARANYHIRKWPKWDVFGGGGIGYLHFKYRAYDNTGQPATLNKPVPGEFGFSLQAGVRHYFKGCFGVYGEVGYVAGAIGQAGLTIRL